MSNLLQHAEHELKLLRSNEPCEIQDAVDKHILKMVEMFSEEGHSGSSAPYCIGILEKLLRFEPINPLTGEEDEWFDHGDGVRQNKRCSHVFKDADNRAYDIDGRIFREPNGSCYTSSDSRVYIEFPYTPRREYVDVPDRAAN